LADADRPGIDTGPRAKGKAPVMKKRMYGLAAVGVASSAALAISVTGPGQAAPGSVWNLQSVPANTKAPGISSPNVLSPGLDEIAVARGSNPLENPGDGVGYYGYLADGPMLPVFPDLTEASKTEPDKNTYLILSGQKGADAGYDYGHRFLFQGHEAGSPGYITRVNLDADQAHKVTMMADSDVDGNPLPDFDGSTWDPFAHRLLFTAELGSDGGVWAATLGYPSQVEDVNGALGQAGYEGVQNDSAGNVWLVEDVGGGAGPTTPHAKQPNSFVYRFVPDHANDLTDGRLQVLQVESNQTGDPIVFHAGDADGDILSPDRKDLHSYGATFDTKWVTIHDTDSDGYAPFDANAAAKAAEGTPFKRPENGAFQPGTGFRSFFFTETGDTNLATEAGADYGGFGAVYRLHQSSPTANTGQLSMFYRGDAEHTGMDNISFVGKRAVVFVEDASDGVHTARNALDSAYLLHTDADYSDPATTPVRILAEGRDPSATIDSALDEAGTAGFQNDGDNELTGIHTSDGDPSVNGILGAKIPEPLVRGTRWHIFYTAQHGDNITWEVVLG
jgi:hypothetical protein